MRTEIDLNTWKRKDHFLFYSKISTPHYCVAFNVDVTNLLRFTRENKISFYYSLIYICTSAINSIDEFLLEIEDDKVYKIDSRRPYFTDIGKDSELFYFATAPQSGDVIEFAKKAREESEKNPLSLDEWENAGVPQVIFSCIPWADITMCSNERDYNDKKLKDDTAPIIVWGKYTERNGRYVLNMTIDVNHRLIDGYYVGLFVKKIEEAIAAL